MSPLKTSYQRNLFLGTIISASLVLLPLLAWYFNQGEMVTIDLSRAVRQVRTDTRQPKSVDGRTGTGQKGEAGKGLKGRVVDIGHNRSGFKIVHDESLPVVAAHTNFTKPTPKDWIDTSCFVNAQGPDMVMPGNPDGDGWPMAPKDTIAQPTTMPAQELSVKMAMGNIKKPEFSYPAIIQLGPIRWPKSPKALGIMTATVKINLYLDNKGNYLNDNGKINFDLISEDPPNKGFLGALLEMIREGYFKSPVELGVPLGCKCTITYIWCKGNDCQSGVTVVSGNIIASVNH